MGLVEGLFVGSFLGPLALFVIGSIIIITALEFDNGWFPAFAVIGTILGLQYLVKMQVFEFLLAHWGLVALYLLGYLVVGGAPYSVLKWWSFSRAAADEIEEGRQEFLKERKITAAELTDEQKLDWEHYFKQKTSETIEDSIPRWHHHKAQLARWVTYWPWSLLWTIVNDPIRRVVRWLVAQLQGVYQHITDRVFANTRKHLLTPERRAKLIEQARMDNEGRDQNQRPRGVSRY